MLAGTAVVADLFYLHMNGNDDTGAPDEIVTVDDIEYYLFIDGAGEAIVHKLADTARPSVTIPETVQSSGGTAYPVMGIGAEAFKDCIGLTNILLPGSITSINNYAFYGCNSLDSFDFPDSLTYIGDYAFYGCENMGVGNIPSGLTHIGKYAFHDCTNLELTSLPDDLTSIGSYAFYNCASLALTSLPMNLKTLGASAFMLCPRLQLTALPNLSILYAYTFSGCTNLALTELPAGLTSIGEGVFSHCTHMTLTELPSSLTSIGEEAFYDCTSINTMTIPASCTAIGAKAFDAGITVNYTLTEGVTLSWEAGAFGDGVPFATYALSHALAVGDDVSQFLTPTFHAAPTFSLGGPASEGLTVGTDGKLSGTLTKGGALVITTAGTSGNKTSTVNFTVNVKEGDPLHYTYNESAKTATLVYVSSTITGDITIPETVEYQGETYRVTAFAEMLFLDRTDITGVTAPSVEVIPALTFQGCTGLTFVNIPSAKSIGNQAFYQCTALKTVNLLPSVGSVGDMAFHGCKQLTVISLPTAMTIGAKAFYECFALVTARLPAAVDIGIEAFYNCQALTSVEVSSAISIGAYAFAYCESLSSISLPLAKNIDDSAFRECRHLTEISLPNVTTIGREAFRYCTGLTTADLPKVTSIGDLAFSDCTALNSISLPLAETLGDDVFSACSSLIELNLPKVTDIGKRAFVNCTSLATIRLGSNGVTFGSNIVSNGMTVAIIMPLTIAPGTWSADTLPYTTPFVIYTTPTDIVIGFDMSDLTVTSYGSGTSTRTFTLGGDAAEGLTVGTDGKITGVISKTGELIISETVGTVTLTWTVSIEQCVIGNVIYLPDLDKDTAIAIGCTADATDITLPYSIEYAGHTLVVVSIKDSAFNDQGITSVVIGTDGKSAITKIPSWAFQHCLSLVSVVLPDSVTDIGLCAFTMCSSLALTEMPAGLISIGDSAFRGCSSLALTELPSGLGYIAKYTFWGCANLRLTSLPDGVTTISENAFYLCSSLALTSLNNVAFIGNDAFRGCTGLKATYDLYKITSIGDGAFASTSGITFKVPLTDIVIGEDALGTGYYSWTGSLRVNDNVSIPVQNKTDNTTYSISGVGADGLTVNKDGTVSGKPQTVGTFTVTAKAKNTSVTLFAVTGEVILPFVLSADTLYCVTGKTVPASDDDIVTIDSAVPSGYTVTWSVTDKSGCGITVVDGVIKGTAGATGTYTITIVRTVTGHGITQEDTAKLTVVITDVLKITSTAKDIVPVQ